MVRRPAYKVDAFTRVPLQGNPAGVLPMARGLSEPEMLAVAREMNVSETAFVLPSREADLRVRFFTPTQEVPLCGHALVATLTLLHELGELPLAGDSARVRVETGAGVIAVDLVRERHGVRVDMTQAPPAFRPFDRPAEDLLEILGASTEDLRADLPLELAYTGLWDLMVPLAGRDALDGLLPDSRALAALTREVGAVGAYAFVEEGERFQCRCFAPAAGIDEDPVTGTSAGAFGAYLLRHGVVRPGVPFIVSQGEACGRAGTVRVVVEGEVGDPRCIIVGGHAVVSLRGQLLLEGPA
ncbi:MAG: PhzF family phenazine biosynthesis isomerase [Deltaproteobacteria bacterium]|nr:PhzF family phenazine biosynthesis isomerase [Deltaproteobacteria bacterium]